MFGSPTELHVPYITDGECRWFECKDNVRCFCGVCGNTVGIMGKFNGEDNIEVTPYENWIGMAEAVAEKGKSDSKKVRELLLEEFSTGIHNNIECSTDIRNPEDYEMDGPYKLDALFAEVTLRALERMDVSEEFLNTLASDFEDILDASRIQHIQMDAE